MEKVVNAQSTTEQFISAGEIDALLTASAINQELERYGSGQILPEVLDRAKKIFAILLVLGRLETLKQMLKSGLNDNDLPFQLSRHQEKNQRFSEFFLNFVEWDVKTQELFMNTQWTFLAPVFRDGEHQKLENDLRLPFINKKLLGSGSYGRVYSVTIPSECFSFKLLEAHSSTKVSLRLGDDLTRGLMQRHKGHVFAVKHFTQDTKEENSPTFKSELAVMKSIQSSEISHITRFYLIFPLAEKDLSNSGHIHDRLRPRLSGALTRWLAS